MKLNDIKFLPKANAFAEVYAKATGMPFIGEMMVAAAGQGGSPEPEPDDFRLTVKVVKEDEYNCYLLVTSNVQAPVENASVYIEDDVTLGGCEGDYTSAFQGNFIPSSADPLVWVSEDYTLDTAEAADGCGYKYIATADWIDGTVTVDGQTIEHSMSGDWEYVDESNN